VDVNAFLTPWRTLLETFDGHRPASPEVAMMTMNMSDLALQTAVFITVPTFAVFVGILMNNSRLNDLRSYMDARFNDVDRRFDEVNRRIDDLKETWRSELRRVEDVIDARLKHLEER
jgi:hypothetical protein